jgi:CRISPR-associated protein Cas1
MTTLYLTEPRSTVKKDGDTLLVSIPGDENRGTLARKVRLPLGKITQVVVMGDSTLTTPALIALLERQVDVCFLSYHGEFQGRLAPADGKNSLLRLTQLRAHDDQVVSLTLAREFVRGKIHNMRTFLLRANRKREDARITAAIQTLRLVLDQIERLVIPADIIIDARHPQQDSLLGTLLGLEGAGSAAYFEVFGLLFNRDWGFQRRTRRPPTDPINALLSYGYTLLTNLTASLCQVVGFDPYIGFLHSSQYSKPALALDLIEEFRTPVVDSVVLSVLNNDMLKPDDFEETFGAYRLKEDGRRLFLTKYEERLSTAITHPVFNYQADYRKCIELQARLVRKWLTGDIPAYKAFTTR